MDAEMVQRSSKPYEHCDVDFKALDAKEAFEERPDRLRLWTRASFPEVREMPLSAF